MHDEEKLATEGPDEGLDTAGEQATEAASVPASVVWRRRSRMLWREWIRPLLIIGIVMGSFRSAVADWNDVPTGSMKPTILEGDRIFINKVAYDLKFPFTTWQLMAWDNPVWGDIIVLRSPEDGKRLVKRVVGVPGDVLEIRGGRLFVNGAPATWEPLAQEIVEQIEEGKRPAYRFHSEQVEGRDHPIMMTKGSPSPWLPPVQLKEDQYFVMGDNRDNSRDSRYFGPVARSSILGRATAVALSVDPEHYYMPRWDRFFSRLP